MQPTAIPDDWRQRAPLLGERAWQGLTRWLQHPDAPRWNRTMGDRVGERELEALARFRRALADEPLEAAAEPSPAMAARVDALRGTLPLLDALPYGFDCARDFADLPTSSREDVARRLAELVPRDAELDRAIVYSTSGTTGHSVVVPSHPGAMVQNLAHLERLAALHGVKLAPEAGVPFALNAGVQQRTYVFATSLAGWGGALLAKVNLAAHDWAGGAASRARFLAAWAPTVLASEPVSLAEALRLELPLRPKLVVSSAVTLTRAAASAVSEGLGAAVVDLYSATETGPVAATLPDAEGHVVLCPDVYVEALDADGERVPEGARGEITVTGGRNPYLPLVRYRTGDHGRLGTTLLPDGRRARVILDLEGRASVSFRALDGSTVTSVDVARTIRPLVPFVQQALVQRADLALELRLRPLPHVPISVEVVDHALRELFGRDARIEIILDPELGNGAGKLVAWQSEAP
ncbi:MAG: AMP-binding protein [Myxococcales bacterium]|nr:AMP-binding protein [Myxococcales bacterium]